MKAKKKRVKKQPDADVFISLADFLKVKQLTRAEKKYYLGNFGRIEMRVKSDWEIITNLK